ncbi:putative Histidine kinase [Candidatus Sulfotelmatobacter kueseliae]|uniref:histidine kinase n=1 Tax=Candidatus Sulfotelmatobacter kueseliae TaxID=2042962 RepID=A0A2U3K025_9BACT|nr:putative Histidine kinase [Candidatus Sulfotelmatobacter kueseliae]
MSGATKSGNGSGRLRILLAGEGQADLADLRELLLRAGADRLTIDCVYTREETRSQLKKSKYDLLLVDYPEGDGGARHWLGEPDGSEIQVPAVFLGEYFNNGGMEAAIQAAACQPGGCSRTVPCLGLYVLSGIETYLKQRQNRNSEEMLQKLRHSVEQSPDLVMITNSAGVLEYVNPAFEKLTGYASAEVLGQTLGILKSDQQSGELYEEMWNTVLSGKVFNGTVMNRKKNGETFVIEKAITPLRNREGRTTHFISTGRDITDQRKLESQLHQSQKMDAIGLLAGGVAHDFNNLLLVISAYAELVLDSLGAEDPSRRKMDEIITATRRAADLTRQLLAFGRKQMQSLRVLDLNTVVGEISRMLPRLIGEDIQVVFVPGQDLVKVKADPAQIEQVVMNLATNARDAMPGGGKLTIETSNVNLDQAYVQRHVIVPAGEYALLAVSDSGEGIAAEHLNHIFEPFYTTKEAGKGTGLGLATAYGIVKQSGGFIWVYSEPGQGTTFKIYLPRVVRAGKVESPPQVAQSSPHGKETVLLVEDEAAVRASTCEFLVRCGYTVVTAENGEEALRVSRDYSGPIHLMISDVVMPKMGGPKVAEQLMAERPGMKVLFVSGYAENTVLQHGKIDVAAQFLSKPFSLSTLANKIREVLETSESLAYATSSL